MGAWLAWTCCVFRAPARRWFPCVSTTWLVQATCSTLLTSPRLQPDRKWRRSSREMASASHMPRSGTSVRRIYARPTGSGTTSPEVVAVAPVTSHVMTVTQDALVTIDSNKLIMSSFFFWRLSVSVHHHSAVVVLGSLICPHDLRGWNLCVQSFVLAVSFDFNPRDLWH